MMLKSCRYTAKFELEGYPKVGNEFTLTLKVKAVYASPMTQMQMSLPKNVTMLEKLRGCSSAFDRNKLLKG